MTAARGYLTYTHTNTHEHPRAHTHLRARTHTQTHTHTYVRAHTQLALCGIQLHLFHTHPESLFLPPTLLILLAPCLKPPKYVKVHPSRSGDYPLSDK